MANPKPIAVIFDHNIYLDIARLLGQPYNESRLRSQVMGHKPDASRPNRKMDAGVSVLLCSTGNLAGQQRIQVWSSSWIERGVVNAAKRPITESGLGWTEENAKALRTELIASTAVGRSNGHSIKAVPTIKYEKLSSDDSSVFHTALQALNLCSRSFCVTSDNQFLNNAPRIGVEVLPPAVLVEMIREARKS